MTIEGSLVGFGDFNQLGADVADRGPSYEIGGDKGKPPKVYKHPSIPKTATVQQHGQVLKKAHHVVTTAATVLAHALHALTKPAAGGRKQVHVGAAAAAAMSPKAKAAVARHNVAVAKAKKATQVLAQNALKTKKSVAALAGAMLKQKKTAVALRTPASKRAHVGSMAAMFGRYGTEEIGSTAAMFGRYGTEEIGSRAAHFGRYGMEDIGSAAAMYGRYGAEIGAEVMKAFDEYYTAVGADPDPNNPGLLTDGSPDPAYAASGIDPATAAALNAPASDPTGQDSGATLPPPPPIDTLIPDLVAAGAILYNGEKGRPNGYVLSNNLWSRATDSYAIFDTAGIDGTDHFGYAWGQYWDRAMPNGRGLPFGDDLKTDSWNHVSGRHILSSSKVGDKCDQSEALNSPNTTSPQGVPFGPLIGNPDLPDFKGMRVDLQGNMGWLPQEAPDWLTFPIKQAAALTAQAAQKAAADAAAAAKAVSDKAAADAAAAKAAQDAQQALAESAATSQGKIDATQQASQQGAAEAQAAQALVEQQQADTAQQQMDTEQTKQSADLLIEQAKRQEAYYAKHPEEEFGPATEPPGGDGEPPMPGMEDGGGEGDYDDGSPVPGGDLMLDQDGEGSDGEPAGDDGE